MNVHSTFDIRIFSVYVVTVILGIFVIGGSVGLLLIGWSHLADVVHQPHALSSKPAVMCVDGKCFTRADLIREMQRRGLNPRP